MVSQESIDVIQSAYDAYNRGDLDTLIDHFSPDAEMNIAALGEVNLGHVAIRRSFEQFFEVVEAPHTDAREFIAAGRQVVVPVHLKGRLRHTGITDESMITEMVHAFAVRDGKIVWNYICTDLDEAIRVALAQD